MKVWQVTWDTYSDSDDRWYPSWELFDSEEAARSSCPDEGEVSEVEVRSDALRTEMRYQVRSDRHIGENRVPEIYEPRVYIVNELQADFGEQLVKEWGWWLDGPTVNAPSLEGRCAV